MLALPLLALTLASPQPTSTSTITLDSPRAVVQVDSGNLKGEPLRLSWSPDGSELYLMSADRDKVGNIRSSRGFIIALAKGSLKSVDQEPDWASKYWAWKAGQSSPAAPAFRITVSQDQRSVRSVAAPTGGALARGGTADPAGGTTITDAASAASTMQVEHVYTLKARGEIIGEWVNQSVVPGLNFGWAPPPRQLLVFARLDGGPLVALDNQGRRTQLQGADKALLPAFSDDGTKLAWLERTDKKHYALTIANVK